jgi:hypothetical protein
VLRTDTDLDPLVVALTYKHLWMVEAIFRSMKSVLETRPIYLQGPCSMFRLTPISGVGFMHRRRRGTQRFPAVSGRLGAEDATAA